VAEHETRIHRNRGGDSNGAAALIAVYHASQGDVTWVLGEDGELIAAIVPAETALFVVANLPPRHGRSDRQKLTGARENRPFPPGLLPGEEV
jgi:hypothetical protein